MLSRLSLPQKLPMPDATRRRASVATIFGPENQLLMIQRAERPGDPWSGQMAFPGGHWEPSDADLRETAIRETQEEIGLSLKDAEFFGALSELQPVSQRHAVWVTPCVFRIAAWAEVTISHQEVAAIKRFSFERFLSGEGRGDFPYTWNGQDLRLPCVRLDGCLIWGLSLRMIDELCEHLR